MILLYSLQYLMRNTGTDAIRDQISAYMDLRLMQLVCTSVRAR